MMNENEQQKSDRRRLQELRDRVGRVRDFPTNTCPASRHLHLIADALASGNRYPPLTEEPKWCAETMLSVLESLWSLRTKEASTVTDKETEPPVQVLYLLESGHYIDAAESWAALSRISVGATSMFCLRWLETRKKEAQTAEIIP